MDATLRQIVNAAMDLVDSRYGALGVLGEGGTLSQFVTAGIDDATTEMIGPLPTGHGLLGGWSSTTSHLYGWTTYRSTRCRWVPASSPAPESPPQTPNHAQVPPVSRMTWAPSEGGTERQAGPTSSRSTRRSWRGLPRSTSQRNHQELLNYVSRETGDDQSEPGRCAGHRGPGPRGPGLRAPPGGNSRRCTAVH